MNVRKAISRLWYPGWLSVGVADYAAQICENGPDANYVVTHPRFPGYCVDGWDWQKTEWGTTYDGERQRHDHRPPDWAWPPTWVSYLEQES